MQRAGGRRAAVQEDRAVRATQGTGADHFVAGEQRTHPRGGRSVHAQLVFQRMTVGAEPRTRNGRQQHERPGLRFRVPGANRIDYGCVAHQNGMEPLTQQPLRELGVATAGANEIRERAEDTVAELVACLEQRLGRGRETDMLAIELAQRVAAGLELCERRLRLPPRRARAQLLFVQRRDVATCTLERLDRLHGHLSLAIHALYCLVRILRRLVRGGLALVSHVGRERELLAQLAAFAI